MKYIDMMKKAKSDGVTSDKAMWKSVRVWMKFSV